MNLFLFAAIIAAQITVPPPPSVTPVQQKFAEGETLDYNLTWLKITGDSSNVHVSRVDGDDRVIREVTRYAAKPVDGDTTDDPEALAELMRALTGRHLCFTWGRWRGWKLTAIAPDDRKRSWSTVGRLVDVVGRARAGEVHAQTILTLLLTRKAPANGPPTLFPVDRQLQELLP